MIMTARNRMVDVSCEEAVGLASFKPLTSRGRASSSLSLAPRNALSRNGRSATFPMNESRSYAMLEGMQNSFLPKITTPVPRLKRSSQALHALGLKKSTSGDSMANGSSAPDVAFFEMIRFNPMNIQERGQYDDGAVQKYIRRHPEAMKVKYDFQVAGRLTVSRYPLSALVALGASLATIKLAIRANRKALHATEDFHSTALHTACSFPTDFEVVKYIHRKAPQAIKQPTKLVFLPLHNACQASTAVHPMLEVIQFLVEEHPAGLMAINKLGDTPLRTAQRKKGVPREVLDYLQQETDRVFALEENQELFKAVSDRQSWGSQGFKMEDLAAAGANLKEDEEVSPFGTDSTHSVGSQATISSRASSSLSLVS